MDYSYFIFWVPTTVTQKEFIAYFPSIKKNISDNSNPHFITLFIDESLDIVIKSDLYGADVKLEFIDNNSIGFLQYRIDQENVKKELLEDIPNAIYHIIKEFFHSHKHHHSEEDSLLSAYCSNSKIDLKHNGNKAILHYLKIYEYKFKRYTRIISDEFVSIENRSKNRPIYKYKEIKAYNILLVQASKALGEKIYCNTLLASKPDGFDNFNIENSINDILILKSRIEDKINYRNSLNSIMLALIGLFLSIVGISLSGISFLPSNKQKVLNSKINEISAVVKSDSINNLSWRSHVNNTLDSIEYSILQHSDALDSIIRIENADNKNYQQINIELHSILNKIDNLKENTTANK